MKRSRPRAHVHLTETEWAQRKFERQILQTILISGGRRCENFLMGAMIKSGTGHTASFLKDVLQENDAVFTHDESSNPPN